MPATITESYRQQQRKLHENPNYGVASLQFAPLVWDVLRRYASWDLLDYGAGKGRLREGLALIPGTGKVDYTPFEPANDEWSKEPEPHDVVACIDVLEHIEPECLDAVLADLRRCMKTAGLFTVHTGRAIKTLPDGRNAHLIQRPASWWLPLLCERFEIVAMSRIPHGFFVIVEPR